MGVLKGYFRVIRICPRIYGGVEEICRTYSGLTTHILFYGRYFEVYSGLPTRIYIVAQQVFRVYLDLPGVCYLLYGIYLLTHSDLAARMLFEQ